jgi:hypothetical protein
LGRDERAVPAASAGGTGSRDTCCSNQERNDVNDLITISESATEAFGAFDWTEHAGKGVRLFVQGFG